MIDRRFLNLQLTVKGFSATKPSSSVNFGDAYIVSDASGWDAGASVNDIAKYEYLTGATNSGWSYTKPTAYASTEVLNLATGEILKYTDSNNEWETVSHAGMLILDCVVDDEVSSSSSLAEAKNIVGNVYIVTYENDNKVYKVTSAGTATQLTSISLGKKVGVIDGGYVYHVEKDGSNNLFFSNDYGYAPENTIIYSKYTNNLYVYDGSNLIPLNPTRTTYGESTGALCTERHVFTATEISNQSVLLNVIVPASKVSETVCFLNGGAHLHGVDFEAERVTYNSVYKLEISWDSGNVNWYTSPPRAGEIAVFQYYKE